MKLLSIAALSLLNLSVLAQDKSDSTNTGFSFVNTSEVMKDIAPNNITISSSTISGATVNLEHKEGKITEEHGSSTLDMRMGIGHGLTAKADANLTGKKFGVKMKLDISASNMENGNKAEVKFQAGPALNMPNIKSILSSTIGYKNIGGENEKNIRTKNCDSFLTGINSTSVVNSSIMIDVSVANNIMSCDITEKDKSTGKENKYTLQQYWTPEARLALSALLYNGKIFVKEELIFDAARSVAFDKAQHVPNLEFGMTIGYNFGIKSKSKSK